MKSTHAFAESVVDEVAPLVPYKRSELLLATTRLVHWASHHEFEVNRGTLFSESTINAFVVDGLTAHSDASRGNIRSQLRRVREVLDGGTAKPERLAAAEPSSPYSKDDLRRFAEWAQRQKTPEFRRDARTILALGFGAGLSAGEIGAVKGENVFSDDLGVQVRVLSDDRCVQVVRDQEARILKAAAAVEPGQYLIRPARSSNPKNLISNIVDRGVASELGPQTQRMRTTWLVRHLDAGTPVAVLMEAAGLESLKALTRYLPFTRSFSIEASRRALRG